MNNKRFYFKTNNDVVKIDCNLLYCDVIIRGTDENGFYIGKSRFSSVKITEHAGTVFIKQTRKPMFKKSELKIYVPAFCIPDIVVMLNKGTLCVSEGIYGDLRVKATEAKVALIRSSFVNADLNCTALKLQCHDISVRNSLDCTAASGESVIDNSFFTKSDIRFKDGDMGITRLKLHSGYFSAENGSISLNLKGAKEDYAVNALPRHGTCNYTGDACGKYGVKVYTGTGNIIIDFTEKSKEVALNGNDNVAEDSCVAR